MRRERERERAGARYEESGAGDRETRSRYEGDARMELMSCGAAGDERSREEESTTHGGGCCGMCRAAHSTRAAGFAHDPD